jgi:hypothetical protein
MRAAMDADDALAREETSPHAFESCSAPSSFEQVRDARTHGLCVRHTYLYGVIFAKACLPRSLVLASRRGAGRGSPLAGHVASSPHRCVTMPRRAVRAEAGRAAAQLGGGVCCPSPSDDTGRAPTHCPVSSQRGGTAMRGRRLLRVRRVPGRRCRTRRRTPTQVALEPQCTSSAHVQPCAPGDHYTRSPFSSLVVILPSTLSLVQ